MDYIFRWIQIRFLSGHQLDLFSGLAPQHAAIPVEGTVNGPGNTVIPSLAASTSDPDAPQYAAETYYDRTPPQQGIAPDPTAQGSSTPYAPTSTPSMEDRGIYHAADAMKSMYDMGDAPSCATCGAIMTRSGSCYRCMSCGSTSGCS
jgi:ribonucleoside-diphosphate reductase alpha chain